MLRAGTNVEVVAGTARARVNWRAFADTDRGIAGNVHFSCAAAMHGCSEGMSVWWRWADLADPVLLDGVLWVAMHLGGTRFDIVPNPRSSDGNTKVKPFFMLCLGRPCSTDGGHAICMQGARAMPYACKVQGPCHLPHTCAGRIGA
jgi:hypothetical protein